MQALIFAGGYGKRLRPLTNKLPKPLLRVGGKPIIDWQISWLNSFGVDSFVILCGYLKNKIIKDLDPLGKRMGIDIEYCIEKKPLGTGGALKNAERCAKEKEFFVINGDVITNMDLGVLKLGSSVAALALTPLKSTFGVVRTRNAKIERFDEKPLLPGYWINAGAYLMNKRIFNYLPEKGDIEKTAFSALAKKGFLKGVKYGSCYWHSIDSLKDLEEVDSEVSAELFNKEKR